MAKLPKFAHIRRNYHGQPTIKVEDIADSVRQNVLPILRSAGDLTGKRIGVTAGSRGVSNIVVILQTIVAIIRECGGVPVVIPTMGSHGGATSEGQLGVLAEYGITEESMRAPIDARMETRTLRDGDIPVIWGNSVADCYQIIAVGRIKPHTGFVGGVESGICKMLTIGCGKQRGAERYHVLERRYGMEKVIRHVANAVIGENRVLAGVGIIENALHQTAQISAFQPQILIRGEEMLLERAKLWMPNIPFSQLHALHVRYVGKEISGSGMDSCIVGRGPNGPRCNLLVRDGMCQIDLLSAGDLTEETHGNCIGLGFADVATKRLIDAVDWEVSRINAETAGRPDVIEAPKNIFCTDAEVFRWLMKRAGTKASDFRFGIIENTLYPGEMLVTPALLPECQAQSDVEILAKGLELTFNDAGQVAVPW